jgi:hypothetical protein
VDVKIGKEKWKLETKGIPENLIVFEKPHS